MRKQYLRLPEKNSQSVLQMVLMEKDAQVSRRRGLRYAIRNYEHHINFAKSSNRPFFPRGIAPTSGSIEYT